MTPERPPKIMQAFGGRFERPPFFVNTWSIYWSIFEAVIKRSLLSITNRFQVTMSRNAIISFNEPNTIGLIMGSSHEFIQGRRAEITVAASHNHATAEIEVDPDTPRVRVRACRVREPSASRKAPGSRRVT